MRFYKAHGLGNDFIIFTQKYKLSEDDIVKLCRPHFGVGADGVVFLTKLGKEYNMIIYNQDGTLASTCGNALRCAAKLLYMNEHKSEIIINTVKEKYKILIENDKIITTFPLPKYLENKINVLNNQEFYIVDASNLHATTNVVDLENFDFTNYAKVLQKNYHVNLEAFKIISKQEVKIRFYEFGVKETNSCTSGTVATFYHLNKSNLVDDKCRFISKGGILTLYLKDDLIYVEGEAKIVFKGELIEGEL